MNMVQLHPNHLLTHIRVTFTGIGYPYLKKISGEKQYSPALQTIKKHNEKDYIQLMLFIFCNFHVTVVPDISFDDNDGNRIMIFYLLWL